MDNSLDETGSYSGHASIKIQTLIMYIDKSRFGLILIDLENLGLK